METKESPEIQSLRRLFREWAGFEAETVEALPKAGSDRLYFRLAAAKSAAIGVSSPNMRESAAFISFSRHFQSKNVPVPEIFAENLQEGLYLQQDLGNLNLLQFLQSERKGSDFPATAQSLYQKSLELLARMQIEGGRGLDYSLCYPRPDFDRQSMLWDLSYFKYYFLKLAGVDFDEQALEDDFDELTDFLLEADRVHFMHRDFQARNIMVTDGSPYFIDFQGGRRGALQYDIASLLWQAKANLPNDTRESLLDHYIVAAQDLKPIDPRAFRLQYLGYVIIRLLQVLGAYGFRGMIERKKHFLESIPHALDNLEWLLGQTLPVSVPSLRKSLHELLLSPTLRASVAVPEAKNTLKLRVRSFSYKRGIPDDPSGNGGGFVFDCRAVPNPGQLDAFKSATGRDQGVIDYLDALPESQNFFQECAALVESAVVKYLERGFTSLMVCFGCTGGQHRSVRFADRLADEIGSKYPVEIDLQHIEQELKEWKN